MRPSAKWSMIVIASLLIIIGFTGNAQDNSSSEEACPALAEQALLAVGENCDAMDRNSACYGFNQVASSFFEPVGEDYFVVPSDRTALRIVETIRTAPMDLDLARWGVAVMNVQANVPNTLPGQAVTFILAGDSEVANDVAPEEVTDAADPIPVITNVRANVRSGASTRNNVLGVADIGTEMLADAVNEGGDWVRVVWREQVGWVSNTVIDATASLDGLPVSDAPILTPMQAFYFSTGIGQPMCNEAPDVIGIHSPEGLTVDLTMNGANINVGSFITLKQLTPTQFILTVHRGHVVSETGDEGFAGQTMVGTLNADSGMFIEWVEVRDATEDELAYFGIFEPLLPELGINLPQQVNQGTGTCAGFVATSPLTGLASGVNAFYWDAPTFNVDNYRVVVYNFGESRTASFETQANETFTSGQLSQAVIGGGFDNFAWEVQALINGRVVCTTPRVENLQRAPEIVVGGGAPPAGSTFGASWACSGTLSFVSFFWSDLPAGESVTFTFDTVIVGFPPIGNVGGTGTTPSGSLDAYTGGDVTNGVASVTDGTVINLPGTLACN